MLGLPSKHVLSRLRKGGVIRRPLSNDPTKTNALLEALKLGRADDGGAVTGKVRPISHILPGRKNKSVSDSESYGINAITAFLLPAAKLRSDGDEEKATEAKSPKSLLWQDLIPPRQEPTDNHIVSRNKTDSNVSSRKTSAIESFLRSTANHQSSNENTALIKQPPRKWWSLNLTPQQEQTEKKKSIFDVFAVPTAEAQGTFDPTTNSAFHEVFMAFSQNEKLSSQADGEYSISNNQKEDVRRWLREPRASKVEMQLPAMTNMCEAGIVPSGNLEEVKQTILSELKLQADAFRKQLDWDQEQYRYATESLRELAQLTFDNHKTLAALIIWEKMKEAGDMRQDTINALLQTSSSLAGGLLSKNRSHSLESTVFQALNPRDIIPTENTDPTFAETLALIHDVLYEPNHQSISIRIRRLLSIGDATGALGLVESSMEGATKFRAYRQVFYLLTGLGDMDKAVSLVQRMKLGHMDVPMEAEVFVQLVASLAEEGYFCDGSKRLYDPAALGYTHAWGPGLLDELFHDMSQHVESISSASAMRLRRALLRGLKAESSVETHSSLLVPLQPTREAKGPHDLVADRVSVDPSTGYCVRSGVTLRQIGLDQNQKKRMTERLLKNVHSPHKVKLLKEFYDWLRTRQGPPYTVIVDGANVAYYMQNFERGCFNVHQIQFVVSALEGIGENPLVIIPDKYRKKFKIRLGSNVKVQQFNQKELDVLARLHAAGRLFHAPQGCLDDYFWILASVSEQRSESSDFEKSRRWSGAIPVVLTNDQSKDHQELQMLEPKLFNRWQSSSIVNYSFTGFVDDVCVDPEIVFNPADAFSREIQGNASANEEHSVCWHLPVQDWPATDWFCVRLPSNRNS